MESKSTTNHHDEEEERIMRLSWGSSLIHACLPLNLCQGGWVSHEMNEGAFTQKEAIQIDLFK